MSNAGRGAGATLLDEPSRGSAGQAWISLRPGTLEGFTTATVTVRRTGRETIGSMRDGGLDPIAIEAVAGDTVVLTVSGGPVPAPAAIVFTVPERKPPVIVRTVPPRGTRDVALNTRMQVIFSEPIADGALVDGSIELRQGGQPVPGRLQFVDVARTTVEFVPEAGLVAGLSYELIVTTTIRDLDGEPLEAVEIAEFTAASPEPDPQLRPVTAGEFAFVRGGRIWVAGPGGQRPVSDPGASSDSDPVWSPDGSRIAFKRSSPLGSTGVDRDIYVMDADGSNLVRLTWQLREEDPSWTPDGTAIIYRSFVRVGDGYRTRMMRIPADGSAQFGTVLLESSFFVSPSLSPDGASMVFTAFVTHEGAPWRGSYDVYAQDLSGVAERRLIHRAALASPPWNYLFPRWSNDGSVIAYTECQNMDGWCALDGRLGIVNLDGSGQRLLAEAFGPTHPEWSPDDAWIAYTAWQCDGAAPCIRRIRPDGSAWEELIVNAEQPAWRPR